MKQFDRLGPKQVTFEDGQTMLLVVRQLGLRLPRLDETGIRTDKTAEAEFLRLGKIRARCLSNRATIAEEGREKGNSPERDRILRSLYIQNNYLLHMVDTNYQFVRATIELAGDRLPEEKE